MRIVLASSGAIDAVAHYPWWANLLLAAALGGGAYGLSQFAKYQKIDSILLDCVQLFMAFGAFVLAMHGIFGNS